MYLVRIHFICFVFLFHFNQFTSACTAAASLAAVFFSLYELITCHVPMVIIARDDICANELHQNKNSEYGKMNAPPPKLSKWICYAFGFWKCNVYYYLARHYNYAIVPFTLGHLCVACNVFRIDFSFFRIHLNDCLY